MTAPLRVGRLVVRTHGGGLGQDVVARNRAQAMLDRLAAGTADPVDHAVLVLRRLRWAVDAESAEAQQARIDAWRHRAVDAWDDPHGADRADAVRFDDEVRLLACATRDAVRGRLTAWYWARIVDTPSAGDTGEALAALWLHRVIWLPAAIAVVDAATARAAVTLLSAAATGRVDRSVRAAFAGAAFAGAAGAGGPVAVGPALRSSSRQPPAVAGGPPGGAWSRAGRSSGDRGPDRSSEAPGRGSETSAADEPADPGRRAGAGDDGELAVAVHHRDLLALLASLAATGSATAPADGTARRGVDAVPVEERFEPESSGRTSAVSGVVPPSRPTAGTDGETTGVSDRAGTAPAPPGRTGDLLADDGPPDGHRSTSSRPTVTALASALYLVNLLPTLGHDGRNGDSRAGRPRTGWAVVEALARDLLGGDPDAAADPLWSLLAAWDGCTPAQAGRTGIGRRRRRRLCTAAREWLDVREVPATAFARPGRIEVTATHVDVVLGLEHIDVAVRRWGLDRDPGWVPSLGRIVAFHFV